MSIATSKRRTLTAEEFLDRAEVPNSELIQGQVVEMTPPGMRHGNVQVEIAFLLRAFLKTQDVGRAFVESGVVTARNPDSVRGPDISMYSWSRLPKGTLPHGYATTAPEVVFEILSPSQRLSELADKANEYLMAGVLAVCVVDPERRSVIVYAENQGPRILTEQDELTLPAPLDDWKPRVGDLFPAE